MVVVLGLPRPLPLLLVLCLCGVAASAASAPASVSHPHVSDDADGAVRAERSTNLSHITGSTRKIQMYVKNFHLQILPTGVVNGTAQDTTDYTILQRTTVNIGQVKIQGVATCQYLCMDSCGLLYGTKDFNDECVFTEMIEAHNYNTYSSAKYSNSRRTMYLALNRRGQSRRVQVRAQQALGKLSTYARVLTKWVSVERVEALLSQSHPLRHHGGGHICQSSSPAPTTPPDPASGDRLKCRRRKKRKKKRRKCEDNKCAKKKVTPKRRKLCEKEPSRKICQRLFKSDLVKNKKLKLKQKKTLKSVKTVLPTESDEYLYTTSASEELSTPTSVEDSFSASSEVYDDLEATEMISTSPHSVEPD